MDIELSLDEIIERKRGAGGLGGYEKRFNKPTPRKILQKPAFKPEQAYDARNKIIQKTRAKITDARDILNQNMRESGIDARQLLLERKKERPLPPDLTPDDYMEMTRGPGKLPARAEPSDLVHKGRFGQRLITMTNRPGGVIQTLWDPAEEARNRYASANRLTGPKPFPPRGYVDHDNMQELEDEEITRTFHLGSYKTPAPPSRFNFGGGSFGSEDVEMTTPNADPFGMYEASRNRIERPSLTSSLASEKLFERRQRNLAPTSNLPDSLKARLYGSEPDRRISHGIYANENGHGSTSSLRSLPLPLPPLGVANNKTGYRLLVSNLHANVTTADIRELFNDIGPMYDAHVVRPGTAEVIYKSLEHAEMAVDAYHQREFDGQPMHCVLVNPHSSIRSATHSSVSSRTVTTNSSGVEVDIDALHSVLFRDR